METIFPGKIDKKQCTDTGMAMVLILLTVIYLVLGNYLFSKVEQDQERWAVAEEFKPD
jgi:hypothetical protein